MLHCARGKCKLNLARMLRGLARLGETANLMAWVNLAVCRRLELGVREYTQANLEDMRAGGRKLHIKVVGLARIAADVTPEPALATIE